MDGFHHMELINFPGNYTCRICNSWYKERSELEEHQLSVHNRDFVGFCVDCGKGFRSQSGYMIHMRMHYDDKSQLHGCQTCGKHFVSQSRLVLHARSHSGFKPFACEFCGKSYKHKKNLKDHTCQGHTCQGLTLANSSQQGDTSSKP